VRPYLGKLDDPYTRRFGLGHMTCYTFGKPYLPTLLAMKLD
jgi:hypothetical protein